MPRNSGLIGSTHGLSAWVFSVVAGTSLIMFFAACTATHHVRSMGALDARAIATRSGSGPRAVATDVYRSVLSRSLYSRCRMFPSDSELFEARARACGATDAAVLGVARLFLEVEASPDVLPVTVADRRLRWLDAPPGRGICTP